MELGDGAMAMSIGDLKHFEAEIKNIKCVPLCIDIYIYYHCINNSCEVQRDSIESTLLRLVCWRNAYFCTDFSRLGGVCPANSARNEHYW